LVSLVLLPLAVALQIRYFTLSAVVILRFRRNLAIEIRNLDEHPGTVMAIEYARARAVPKPWGVVDLFPWNSAGDNGAAVGEVWYERADSAAAAPSLLLKLLFTSQPISIQVHPNDAFAHSISQPNGKTEAWCVLSAAPEAKVALGLRRRLTPQRLREAIVDSSIRELIEWRTVLAGDVIFVPAGTIHAIGAGLVLAEVQQRSDVTFRLFDYERRRELHIENAIAVADTGPAVFQVHPEQLTPERKLFISNPYFVFEQIDLSPNSCWSLEADRETWLLVIRGGAAAGSFDVATGETIFAQSDRVNIHAGAAGMVCLVAYTGGAPIPDLLRRLIQPDSIDIKGALEIRVPASLTIATDPQKTAARKH
jgi:mannose-6-phosphate isomerase